ncbi:DUF2510 domain-containing protein [Streptosporangium sp. NPDC087985]|uniref:DUF2510 domain-containing protein n=1 Tax=Streptosporangium sp. NPDC087985 TaxID=3366196 RepID=UPI00381B4355
MTTQTPSGWYPDPYGSPQLRWWDGTQWTDATHPADAPAGQAVPQTPQSGATVQMSAGMYGLPAGPPPGKSRPRPWILSGGAAAAVVIVGIVIAALFLVSPESRPVAGDPTPVPTLMTQEPALPPTPEPPTPEPSAPPSDEPDLGGTDLPRPRDGRIKDPVTGLSYAFPGSPWKVPERVGGGPLRFTWTSAAVATSQENFDGQGSDWVGNIFVGELPDHFGYDGVASMQATVATLLHATESTFYSPGHGRKILRNKATKVGGRDAWVFMFEMDFSKESAAKGWKWKKERGAFVIVDRGEGARPGLVYVSVPDNLGVGVTGRVVDSLKLS